jgi:hypothetical protein
LSATLKKEKVQIEMDSSLRAGVWRITCQFANGIHLINPTMSYHIAFTLMHQNSQSVLFLSRLTKREKYILFPLHPKFWLLLNKSTQLELLAIVYALNKFRIYVFGHKILLRTDNKALSFLQKRTMISNRITRWVLQLQEYDIEIGHISGTQNYLADIIRPNPAGPTPEHNKQLTRPRDIMVGITILNIDP